MEDKIGRLFQPIHPDVLLPIQYWETVSRRDRLEPEKRLMLAVLEDAIWTYKKYLPKENCRFLEVEDWLLDTDDDRLFSFENICDVLGLSSEHIRQQVRLWKEEERAQHPAIRLSPRIKNKQRNHIVRTHIWINRTGERPRPTL
jgi:hypothetical protein